MEGGNPEMNVLEVRTISKNVIQILPALWEYWAWIKFILWIELENDLLDCGGDVRADTGKDPSEIVSSDIDTSCVHYRQSQRGKCATTGQTQSFPVLR